MYEQVNIKNSGILRKNMETRNSVRLKPNLLTYLCEILTTV